MRRALRVLLSLFVVGVGVCACTCDRRARCFPHREKNRQRSIDASRDALDSRVAAVRSPGPLSCCHLPSCAGAFRAPGRCDCCVCTTSGFLIFAARCAGCGFAPIVMRSERSLVRIAHSRWSEVLVREIPLDDDCISASTLEHFVWQKRARIAMVILDQCFSKRFLSIATFSFSTRRWCPPNLIKQTQGGVF